MILYNDEVKKLRDEGVKLLNLRRIDPKLIVFPFILVAQAPPAQTRLTLPWLNIRL